jgi:hypothetical protein
MGIKTSVSFLLKIRNNSEGRVGSMAVMTYTFRWKDSGKIEERIFTSQEWSKFYLENWRKFV